MRKINAGFTLMELVIATTIVAILASIAIPSYSKFVLRGNRAVVRSLLISLAAKQEVQALQTQAYATTFAPLLAVNATSFYIDHNGTVSTASTSTSIYQVSFAATPAASATAYAFQATPVGSQVRDTDCQTMTLQSTGLKQAVNSSNSSNPDCWIK